MIPKEFLVDVELQLERPSSPWIGEDRCTAVMLSCQLQSMLSSTDLVVEGCTDAVSSSIHQGLLGVGVCGLWVVINPLLWQ